MLLSLPIYVEQRKVPHRGTEFSARSLYGAGPAQRGPELSRVLQRLGKDLRKLLAAMGRERDHAKLLAWTRAPELEELTFKDTLHLRRRTLQARFLFVVESTLGRRLAYTPSLPGLLVSVERGERLQTRIREELTRFYKEVERREALPAGEQVGIRSLAWVTTLELEVSRAQRLIPPTPQSLMLLGGGGEKLNGADELHDVGRCLDWRYPHDLQRAILREAEVEQLSRALADPTPRPILVVGPAGVGKTCLIHEVVWRRVAARRSPQTEKGTTWQLAPQRLISGMSVVGAWEERVLAILRHARKKNLILSFDDLLGLYEAGKTGQSSLCVADLLREQLAREPARILAEATPEELRVLRELDRGFADRFQIIRVREPGPIETRKILLRLQRRLEDQQSCRFELEALPVALELTQSFLRDRALPGKAAGFLEALAIRGRKSWIGRRQVLEGFTAQTGLSVQLLDERVRLKRGEVLDALRQGVIGQASALESLADVVSPVKARLGDPERPAGVFLFLGPTGVGKTETAKSLARYLFGDEERLLRFDLNEFVDPSAASRLAGSFSDPEGLLTGALRRQPFCVLLLDEIEKAHPDVFDLLLQALGEGRLTNARGRTADLTNAVVILTSNLGVRAAENTLGFREDQDARDQVYVEEAERFFRPEFFNRLDRVIPFSRLSRAEVGQIAARQVQRVLQRGGFVRRRALLEIHPLALERITELGYHPQLGARALKRALEEQLVRRAALDLASISPKTPVLLSLYGARASLELRVQALDYAERELDPPAPEAGGMAEFWERLERVRESLRTQRPPGELTSGGISPAAQRYYALSEWIHDLEEGAQAVEQALDEADEELRSPHLPRVRGGHPSRGTPKVRWKCTDPTRDELHSAADLREYVRELARSATPLAYDPLAGLSDLQGQLSFLELLSACEAEERVLVLVWLRQVPNEEQTALAAAGAGPALGYAAPYLELLQGALGELHGYSCAALGGAPGLVVEGAGAREFLQGEVGAHLFCPPGSALVAVQVSVFPLAPEEDPLARARRANTEREAWIASLGGSESTALDPFPLGQVRRIYEPGGSALDLASGQTSPRSLVPEDLRAFLLGRLARRAAGGDS